MQQAYEKQVIDNFGNKGTMAFPIVQSEEEAYAMYCDYAHKTGFSVRKRNVVYWTHKTIIKGRGFCCAKAGVKRSKPELDEHKKYRKLDTRTNCLACIYFNVDMEGKNWEVTKFVEEHNHPLASENDKHLLRSHRSISNVQASLLKNMTGVGIRTTDAYNFLADEVGGVENVGFCKSDAYNFVQRERRALIDSGDAISLSKILQERQSEDNMFSFDIQTDEMNRLISFFWIDGQSKIDYDCFGDVIVFDTTYRLNKYNLACAPFIAVNHHLQNIFVGGAFIATETIESFCWVFETFLRFVGGKQPATIFTDQDQAMAVAIERTFPDSRHRLCQWHIAKKAPSKVPTFNNDKGIRSLFYYCMCKCDSEIEFERCWSDMIIRGKLDDNRWLRDLYKVRMKWSTAFNKASLDLGILSTQRSESANNVLHGCSKATSSLVECFLGLDKLTSTWRRSEHDEDFRCKHGSITLKFHTCPLLKQISKIYTRKSYSKFEQAYSEGAIGICIVEESRVSDNHILYATQHSDGSEGAKQWFVTVDSTNYDADCSCRGFQTKGILCKHILRVYNHKNVRQIPAKYILSRFTLKAKKGMYLLKKASLNDFDSNVVFRNHMMRLTYDLTRRVEDCNIAKEYVLSAMNEIAKKSDDMVDEDEKMKKGIIDETNKDVVRDPPAMRRKGLSNSRPKSHWEKPMRRKGGRGNSKGKATFVENVNTESKEYNFVDNISFGCFAAPVEVTPSCPDLSFGCFAAPVEETPSCPDLSFGCFAAPVEATPSCPDLNDEVTADHDIGFHFPAIPDVFKW